MGNACFGNNRSRTSTKGVMAHHHHKHHHDGSGDKGGGRRLKVRMSSELFKELVAKAKEDASGKELPDTELGRLVFKECLKRSLHSENKGFESTFSDAKGRRSLSPILEHSDDDDDDDDRL